MRENINSVDSRGQLLISEIALAGKRDFNDSEKLLDEQLAAMTEEKQGQAGKISGIKNIDELRLAAGEKIVEGAVSYTRVNDEARIEIMSDIHGSSQDLKKPMAEFAQQKLSGEKRYFNFLGDIGAGPHNKVTINESFASLKKIYPQEVNINAGNADRRSASLFFGLPVEITQKFFPELYEILSKKTEEELRRFYQTRKVADSEIDKKLKTQGFEYYTFFAANFLRAARESGAEPFKLKDFDVMYQVMRGAVGMDIRSGKTKIGADGKRYGEKKTETPNVFTFGVLRHLVEALKPEHKPRQDDLIKDDSSKEKILEVFNYWRKQNEIANEEPVISFYESDNTIVVCSHSGMVKEISGLGDLVDNEEFKTKATWNQFIKDEVAKLGEFDIYNQEDLGKFLGKIVPKGKNVIYVTGHNHGNKIEEIKVLDQAGKDSGNRAIRVEVCSGESKNKEPKYIVIDLAKIKEGGELEQAVEYKDTK
jgi:hypothetical protein